MDILILVLNLIATVCGCAPSVLKGKRMTLILLLVFMNNLLVAISYILTGAMGGAAICFVGAAMSIVNFFFDQKNKPLPKWLLAVYAAAFTAANLATFAKATDLIALIAALAFVMAVSQKSGKGYRIWAMANAGLWLVYDIITFSWGPLLTHGIQTTIIIIGMLIHDRKQKSTEA